MRAAVVRCRSVVPYPHAYVCQVRGLLALRMTHSAEKQQSYYNQSNHIVPMLTE